MIKRRPEFHELAAPSLDCLDDNSWCVCDIDASSVYYLLNDGTLDLGDLLSGLDTKWIYFNTEAECHAMAAKYYDRFGRNYPYMDEWAGCMAPDGKQVDEAVEEAVVQSEVMYFV
jgi:hypothetical protein